jgi:hypothetical protein
MECAYLAVSQTRVVVGKHGLLSEEKEKTLIARASKMLRHGIGSHSVN